MGVTQDGPEALKPWPQHRWKIDLLPPDTAMPGGISGRELADHLLRASPYPRFDSTGYGVNLPNSDINLAEGVNCLLKPYDDITPVRAVKKAFANGN
jgi:hypothetical protein